MNKNMIAITLLILSCFPCNASDYILPPSNTKSLVQDIHVKRNEKAWLVVEGKTCLPQNTKIHVDVFCGKKALIDRSDVGETVELISTVVGPGGIFNAGPFTINQSPPKSGKYRVEVMAYFNGAWQSTDILEKVGVNGTKLPLKCLIPDDPEFPKNGGHIKYSTVVILDTLSPNIQAIEAVKNAKLYVHGKGKAVDTIAEIVDSWNKPGTGFIPGEWNAIETKTGKWIVSLHGRWGNQEKDAQWEYDAKTGNVKYLDPEAKTLSWLPAE